MKSRHSRLLLKEEYDMGKKLIMIGHGHLDPVWLWEWQEGMQEVKATFRSALDRMDEYDEFVFTCSSAAFYEFVEENDPEMFREIKRRIEQGRWNIVGGWWIEPDCNIPCGESFARQALIAQRYYMEKFGTIAETGFCPDSFGHAGTLPMLLRGGRMKNYVFMRPMPGEKPLPKETFDWYAPDGSKVRTFRLPYEYLSWENTLKEHIKRCMDAVREPLDQNMCFYGVGNHGGGPTRANLECIRTMRSEEGMDISCGTVEEYFAALDTRTGYPEVTEELQYHSPGCYSACRMVKQYNRKSENCLIQSEVFCCISDLEQLYAYPDNCNEAWKRVLFNQFHDILAGTCIAPAYEHVRDTYGFALTIGHENMNHALQSVAWNIDIKKEEGMLPVVLFHSHSRQACQPVEVEFQGTDNVTSVLDCDGRSVPYAVIPEESLAGRRTRIVFQAAVPSLGYCVYRVYRENTPRKWDEVKKIEDSIRIENEYLELTFKKDGCPGIDALYDKENEVSVSHSGLGIPRVMEDAGSDTWAHNVYRFNEVCGEFSKVKTELTEANSVRQGVRVTSVCGSSVMIQEFYLYYGSRNIRVSARLLWQEKGKVLKLCFRPDTIFNRCTYEVPYGRAERAVNGSEVCAQRWLDYAGVDKDRGFPYGLGLVNDSQYSFSAEHQSFSMTAVRSAVYAHHEPEELPCEERRHYMDQGWHEFQYILIPYKGAFETSGIIQEAEELNSPLRPLVETWHRGKLPMSGSYAEITSENISITAFKKAESKNGFVMRMQELYGSSVQTQLILPKQTLSFSMQFQPNEVKSIWLYDAGEEQGWKIQETDFLEMEDQ